MDKSMTNKSFVGWGSSTQARRSMLVPNSKAT
jgi:hypothetical protein